MAERLPRILLHVEGAALGVAAIALYFERGESLLLFVALILAPDVSLLGYLAGGRAGAVAYDFAHTLSVPLVLGLAGYLAGSDLVVAIALVWIAHIGVDRAIGYGLKYPTGFKDTHLQRV